MKVTVTEEGRRHERRVVTGTARSRIGTGTVLNLQTSQQDVAMIVPSVLINVTRGVTYSPTEGHVASIYMTPDEARRVAASLTDFADRAEAP